jgi:hypothetical protein
LNPSAGVEVLNVNLFRGLIVLGLFAGLFVYDRKADTRDLYKSIHAGLVEFRSDAGRSRSRWPERVMDYDSRATPVMDVWPRSRRYSFSFPYLWDGLDGEDVEIAIIGEAMATGVVLGTDLFHRDFQDLSPVDVALGWGEGFSNEWLDDLQIWFGNRRANLRSSHIRDWTNMHTIPGSPEIASALSELEGGDRLVLRGYAVRVEASREWKPWVSDLKFGDSNCEILIITEIFVEDGDGDVRLSLSIDDYDA